MLAFQVFFRFSLVGGLLPCSNLQELGCTTTTTPALTTSGYKAHHGGWKQTNEKTSASPAFKVTFKRCCKPLRSGQAPPGTLVFGRLVPGHSSRGDHHQSAGFKPARLSSAIRQAAPSWVKGWGPAFYHGIGRGQTPQKVPRRTPVNRYRPGCFVWKRAHLIRRG